MHQDLGTLQLQDKIASLYKEVGERESSVWAVAMDGNNKKNRIVITVNPLDPHKSIIISTFVWSVD